MSYPSENKDTKDTNDEGTENHHSKSMRQTNCVDEGPFI
jgi:hypothetical protein